MRVAVVGAGIAGVALAAELLDRAPAPQVILLEAESQPGLGATAKATGGLRHQFSTETHVRLSLLSIPVYRGMREAGFRPHGYLFVTADAGRFHAMEEAVRLQNRLGAPSRLMDRADVAALVPGIRTDDVAGASFCPADGSANPTDALRALLRQARGKGLDLRLGQRVEGLLREGGRVTGVAAAGEEVRAEAVVVAAGALAPGLLAGAGVQIPVRPFRRQVFVMTPPPGFARDIPMAVDQDTGWYVHPERSGLLLFGGTDRDDRPGLEEVVDWDGLPRVLAAATHRVPGLAEASLVRGYAGVRALTPDDHPIVGPVAEVPGLWLSVGWGGHGFMHAPGGARVLADLLLRGRTELLDARALSPGRFRDGGGRMQEKTAF